MSFRRTVRLGLLAVPLTVFALSACGGGGSTTAVPRASIPTATPAPNPTAAGDTFTYSGSLTQTFTLESTPAPAPAPSASPQPTATPWVSTTTQTVTQNVSVSTGQSFGGQTGLTELTTKETDASPLESTSLTSQTYLSYAPDSSRANGVDVTEAGTATTGSNGASLQSVLASGNGVVEELPSVYGARWSNGAARTDTEKDPDGQTSSATYAADGSYQEQIAYPEGGTAAVQTNADGSGVYKLPLGGTGQSSVTVSAPAGGQIQLAYQILGPGFPQSGAFTLPNWYPQPSPVLASDTYVDEGSASLPASCNAGSSFASVTAEKIVETKTRLDTVFGEYENDQTTQYVSPSYGLLCTVVSDDLKSYYDYSGQSQGAFTFSAQPLEDTTVTETLGLQSASLAPMTDARRKADAANAQAAARPSFARVRMILAGARARDIRALYTRVHSISSSRQSQ